MYCLIYFHYHLSCIPLQRRDHQLETSWRTQSKDNCRLKQINKNKQTNKQTNNKQTNKQKTKQNKQNKNIKKEERKKRNKQTIKLLFKLLPLNTYKFLLSGICHNIFQFPLFLIFKTKVKGFILILCFSYIIQNVCSCFCQDYYSTISRHIQCKLYKPGCHWVNVQCHVYTEWTVPY